MVKKQSSFNYKVKFSKKSLIVVLIIILILGLIYFSKRFLTVATVNGESISRLTVIKKLEAQGGKKTLESIVTEILIRQEAEKRKVNVSQKDLDSEMKKIEASVTSQGSTLEQALQNQGMTKNDLKEQIKIQLMLQKIIGDNVKVSDKEINDFITSTKDQQGTDQEIPREQVAAQIKQEKLQQKIQSYLAELKSKAKITYLVNY